MIERVAQHQTRFRTPGVAPDARGVALGPLGLVLLPSIEKLVAFLRALGEEGALDELLDALRIVQVISPLRTRELLVEMQAVSSHRMDRVAAVARLVGAMVFTGSGRHFVKYRDAHAPFGYDISELVPDAGDLALYHDRFAQPYRNDRVIPLRELLLRLAPVAVHRARAETPRLLYALLRPGLGDAVVGYLARWNVNARVAVVEWQRGGTSDVVERAWLVTLPQPAPRYVSLLRSLPGVTLFVPDGERTAVEYAFRHPIPLSACAQLFASEELVLFRAGGEGPIPLAQRPPFVDVQTVTSLVATAPTTVERARTFGVESSFSLPLRLVPSGGVPKRVSASVIALGSQDTLGRILSVLPAATLGKVTIAFTEDSIYVYGPDAVHALPLGVLYEELGDGVLVPLGWSLSPPIPPDVLRQLSRAPSDARLFVRGGERPLVSIPQSAFVPATRVLLADQPVYEDALIAPPLDAEAPLPDLWPALPGTLARWFSPGARGELPPPRETSPVSVETAGLPDGTDGSRGG
ncbi:MAG: hypothetical protein R3A52_26885 [Polyangiales bacterium]